MDEVTIQFEFHQDHLSFLCLSLFFFGHFPSHAAESDNSTKSGLGL